MTTDLNEERMKKSFFSPRYRIVRDRYLGFEVQKKVWWLPFWYQPQINTHASIEKAKQFASTSGKSRVVMYLDDI